MLATVALALASFSNILNADTLPARILFDPVRMKWFTTIEFPNYSGVPHDVFIDTGSHKLIVWGKFTDRGKPTRRTYIFWKAKRFVIEYGYTRTGHVSIFYYVNLFANLRSYDVILSIF